ncbi:transcriptional regulator, XRE family [Segniliparus rotundus DSM 44985]|uniref:Transcriptional regulator, XRE family n=1 Tax=Segniliparus rotundus (strain ATCC BAA-972 / CDC 1076 / CIP 108378 / DSM 44985 / JCM 13578) TaxID=640132 RepID=D6Z8U2_SEGRD|nr:acetate metabolism transcriptional regulator RamB [Segniliparus rotundus]ADG98372.1 transcriptional regulator, XRE family [Segniliparus rotundus DSM 44985]
MVKTYAGPRLRQLRVERGLSQVALAADLAISPSYLNQIEHDVRPLTVPLLVRLSETLGVDAEFFTAQEEARLVAEIREVAMDTGIDIGAHPEAVTQVVSAHPKFARAMLQLYHRYRELADQFAALGELRTGEALPASASMPHEEVQQYFYERQNYLDSLDRAAEDVTRRMRMNGGELHTEIPTLLRSSHGVRIVERVDLPDRVSHQYDPATRSLSIANRLSPGQRIFKLATELAFLEHGELIDELTAEGDFSSEDSVRLARMALAKYYAAAIVLPYRQFHEVAEEFRYDIERLSAYFAVSYETICHRLSTMQRANPRGVPFSFVRVDRAGNMSKRQSATGFHFSSSGGTCPLWNVYETFASPGKILTQLAQMPDGRSYLWMARTVERRAARYGQPGKTFGIGLGCETRHAHRLVYADGLDLASPANATPIGSGCRVCERESCPQRAFPPLGRKLDLDEHRSTITPYAVEPR